MNELGIGDHVKIINEKSALFFEVGVIIGTRGEDTKLKVKIVDGPVVWLFPDELEKIL